jgi:hypothetical protein
MKLSNSFQNSNMSNLNKDDKYWQELKNDNYNNTFPKVETWVNNLNSEKSQTFNLNRIHSMKNFFALNKFKLVYSVLILAVVFAACNMPVTQNETLGHAISWKVSKNSTEAQDKINSLTWIDKSKLSVQEQSEGDKAFLNYSLILENKSNDEMHNYMNELQNISGIASVQLFPLNQTMERPLYAAALHSFFRVEVDARNKSDAQVTDELQKQLKAAGVEDIKVGYKTISDGQRILEVQPTESGLNGKEDAMKNKDFELSVKDGQNEQFIKTRHKTESLNLEGKSDEEIKKAIVEDMKKNGTEVKSEDLKIERDAQGHVKVEFTNKQNTKGRKMENKIELNVK